MVQTGVASATTPEGRPTRGLNLGNAAFCERRAETNASGNPGLISIRDSAFSHSISNSIMYVSIFWSVRLEHINVAMS